MSGSSSSTGTESETETVVAACEGGGDGDEFPAGDKEPRAGGGPVFWVGLVVGWALIVVGVKAALGNRQAHPPDVARFVLGFAVGHDALLLGGTIVLGLLTALLPAAVRVPVRVGLAVSWLLVLFTWPYARRYGAASDNPSLLPVDVARNVAVAIVVVWILVVADAIRRVVASRIRPVIQEPAA